jgi:hypothetical protein
MEALGRAVALVTAMHLLQLSGLAVSVLVLRALALVPPEHIQAHSLFEQDPFSNFGRDTEEFVPPLSSLREKLTATQQLQKSPVKRLTSSSLE